MTKQTATLTLALSLISNFLFAQQTSSDTAAARFTLHAQTTVIDQTKLGFSAKYSGDNSLLTKHEEQESITTTAFLGLHLWKGASLFLNPEVAGGSGVSQALGIAAATNGETFRIGSLAPRLYLARLYWRQLFALSDKNTNNPDGFNQMAGALPEKYMAFTIGKVSIADFFDCNKFSHDPRTQFLSWALMGNGAWDYPANTRGYTPSAILEYISPSHELRYAFSMLPVSANGSDMNKKIGKANAQTLEYTHRHKMAEKDGAIRILAFYNTANMGNYRQSIAQNVIPDIIQNRQYGRHKYGLALNIEQDLTNDLGMFFRASYNDGHNETWVFTEIDRSISAGLSLQGQRWKRKNDVVGLAYVRSGLSAQHRDYLKAGGKGFMLGDGNLNYAPEQLTEFYYSAELLPKSIYLTGTYQLLINPAYNKDRQGPVNFFSVRVHARI